MIFQNTNSIEIIPLFINFNRSDVRKDNEYLYLFTDNAGRTSGKNKITKGWYLEKYGPSCYPTMTQAVIRGLNNAYPITTTVDDKRTQWREEQLEEYKEIIDDEINQIKKSLYKYKGIKYSAQMPFGRGKISKLPDLLKMYLDIKLLEIGIKDI